MPGESDSRAADLTEQVKWMASAALAASHYGVRAVEIMDIRGAATRARGELLNARRAALYLANTGANLSSRALRRATGMERAAIRKHLNAVEDDRDVKAGLDALLDTLTGQLQEGLRVACGGDLVADTVMLRRKIEEEQAGFGARLAGMRADGEVAVLRSFYGLRRRTGRLLWLLQAAPDGRLSWAEHTAAFEARWPEDVVGSWTGEGTRMRQALVSMLVPPQGVVGANGQERGSRGHGLVPPRQVFGANQLTAAGLSAIRDLLARRVAA